MLQVRLLLCQLVIICVLSYSYVPYGNLLNEVFYYGSDTR